jgi:hypothetical protein
VLVVGGNDMEAKHRLVLVYPKFGGGRAVARLLLALWLVAAVALPLTAPTSRFSGGGTFAATPTDLTEPPGVL